MTCLVEAIHAISELSIVLSWTRRRWDEWRRCQPSLRTLRL